MARQRDYRAEYRRRQALARQLGYPSYWQRRRTEEEAAKYEGRSRQEFMRLSRRPRQGQSPSDVRALWAEGDQAMRDKDYERAGEIARELGYKDSPKGPPQRVFWYH